MDWYNTVYWAQHGQAFDAWGSVYPPTAILFTKMFSLGECYSTDPIIGRSCDKIGIILLTALVLLNTVLSYFAFRKAGIRAAVPRAIAIGLGAPMLLAWERGNLIIVGYTFLILAYSRLLKSGWLKAACAALTICFKPYLVLLLVSPLVKRKWRWLEGVGVAIALIYTVSYVILGEGDPFQLARDLAGFGRNFLLPSVYSIRFAATYAELIRLIDAPYPLMHFVGSKPIEITALVLPALSSVGKVGVLMCVLLSAFHPKILTANRLFALMVCLFFNIQDVGGYALCFLLFFVFLERRTGIVYTIILLSAYLWCVPYDYPILKIEERITYDYITGRGVFEDVNLTVGQFIRPALFFMIEYGLISVTVLDFVAYARSRIALPAAPPDGGFEIVKA